LEKLFDTRSLIWYTVLAGEDTHHKKRSKFGYLASEEVHIIKTVSVVDIYGNEYEPTYPKRAKGLVKKGRAHFVDETTICLVRPPYHTEDEMEEKKTIPAVPEGEAVQLNAAYVIAKIEQIMAESENLHKALELLSEDHNDAMGNTAMGIGNMIEAREQTNQAMISLLKLIVQKL